jgi:hypothetical protein
MFIELLRRRWHLVRKPLGRHRVDGQEINGYCTHPDSTNKQIVVDSRLKDRIELEILIHEMHHAMNWSLSEDFITESSRDLANALWKLGYRKVTDEQ